MSNPRGGANLKSRLKQNLEIENLAGKNGRSKSRRTTANVSQGTSK